MSFQRILNYAMLESNRMCSQIILRTGITCTTMLLCGEAIAAAPVAQHDNRSVPVNTPITIDVLRNDFDADGDTLTISSLSTPSAGGTATINGNAVRYTPPQDFNGTDTFTYTVDDGQDGTDTATVTVTVSDQIFTELSAGKNNRSVASALDAACNALDGQSELSVGQSQLRDRCQSLTQLANEDNTSIALAINRIAPEETVAMMQTSNLSAASHTSATSEHLSRIGGGVRNISINGVSLYDENAQVGGSAGEDDLLAKFGFFASVQLESAEQDKGELEAGFEYDANSVTIGADYAINSELFLGAAIGSSENELHYLNQGGIVDTNNITSILYGLYYQDQWSLQFQLGYGDNHFDIYRTVEYNTNFESFSTTTYGATSGSQLFAEANWQYAWQWQAWSLLPAISINHAIGKIDSYSEINAQGFEVNLGEQEITQTTIGVHLDAQYVFNMNWGVLIPAINLSAISEHSDQDDVQGQFAFSPSNDSQFLIQSEDADSLSYRAGINLAATLPRGISVFLSFNKVLGYDLFSAETFETGFRLEF